MMQSCDNPKCGCIDSGANITSDIEGLTVSIPNAVNEMCSNFTIALYADNELDINNQIISLVHNGTNLTASIEPSDVLTRGEFVVVEEGPFSYYAYVLQYPIGVFEIAGIIIKEELVVEMQLVDSEGNTAQISGTTYFYTCTDITEDFDEVDCRWPSQIEQSSTIHGGSDCLCP